MDRQAWIAVTLCVLGLLGWYGYTASHMPPPRQAAFPSPTPAAVADASAAPSAPQSASPSPATSSAPAPAPGAAPSAASFGEKSEVLANGDVELRLTNRGGAISEAVLLNHTLDKGNRVSLNGPDRTPIGAIVEQPGAEALPEFAMDKQPDGSVQFENKMPDGVTIRKR